MEFVPPIRIKLPHLEFEREPDWQPDRKKRQRPPPLEFHRERREHGRQLQDRTAISLEHIVRTRSSQGIDPRNLIVLEFNTLSPDLHQKIDTKFQGRVVDEQQWRDEYNKKHYNVIVQFPDTSYVDKFIKEAQLYQEESLSRAALTAIDRNELFDGLEDVRTATREDRLGERLRRDGYPNKDYFYLDVDLWHPDDSDKAARILMEMIREICKQHSGARVQDEIRTSTLLLCRIWGNEQIAEALLEMDYVARVDRPPQILEACNLIFSELPQFEFIQAPAEDSPLACVIDSGVTSGHPLLRNWVIDEWDFDTGEMTSADLNGHGTAMAGLVVYGDMSKCLSQRQFVPKVRICSAKILRHQPGIADPSRGGAVFPEDSPRRIEYVVQEAILHFYKTQGCRIFNLSIGDPLQVYEDGKRQFAWAELLDSIARELDIVIVVSAGNVVDLPVPDETNTRGAFQRAVRDQLLQERMRICNPGTAAIALTVGALARSDGVVRDNQAYGSTMPGIAASPAHAPAPYSRTGPGYTINENNSGIKPDLVHYGGNYALQALAGGEPRWWKQHYMLSEPVLHRDPLGRPIGLDAGTSLAAACITHIAALAEQSLRTHLGRQPTANLIRALVASSATEPGCGSEWLVDEQRGLRLVGYGFSNEQLVTASTPNRVCLLAEDRLDEDMLHIYRIPVPSSFIGIRGRRSLNIALAYDPPVRASRRDYLACTLTAEVFQGVTIDEIEAKLAKGGKPGAGRLKPMKLRPTTSTVEWSTLQVRRLTWSKAPQWTPKGTDPEPTLYVVVKSQKRFETGLHERQRYGLVVVFEHENEHINLHSILKQRIRVPGLRARVGVSG